MVNKTTNNTVAFAKGSWCFLPIIVDGIQAYKFFNTNMLNETNTNKR